MIIFKLPSLKNQLLKKYLEKKQIKNRMHQEQYERDITVFCTIFRSTLITGMHYDVHIQNAVFCTVFRSSLLT